jgi:hypothetical protein
MGNKSPFIECKITLELKKSNSLIGKKKLKISKNSVDKKKTE